VEHTAAHAGNEQELPQPGAIAKGSRLFYFACGIIFVAFNLRTAYPSLAAVLADISSNLGLTPAAASAITTLPVLCLGLFAPVAPWLARKMGTERTILVLMAALSVGLLIRGVGNVSGLVVGSIVIGSAIAIINVLLPGLIKRDFAKITGLMAGLYSMALLSGAATAAGFTLALQSTLGGGWTTALALWSVPAAAACACWFFQLPKGTALAPKAAPRVRGVWRCALAWQLTLFMVLQAMYSFTVFGWLAPFLNGRGMTPLQSSVIVSSSILLQMVACLLGPLIATRLPNQSWFNVLVVVLTTVGFLGCLSAPLDTVWLWAGVQGVGQGALTSIAITMIVLRSANAQVAAELSSMVQGIGYSLGALGPLLVGVLYTPAIGYAHVEIFLSVVGVAMLYFGYTSGRRRLVAAHF